MSELKKCPFCGGKAIVTDTCRGLEECKHFESCEQEFYSIVCDFNNGGCGASSGYRPTKEKAIEAWNNRK